MTIEIRIPDIGTTDGVEVIEVLVKVGDSIEKDQSLIVLESDKASMEVPAQSAGVIKALRVNVGDTVKEGDVIAELDAEDAPTAAKAHQSSDEPKASQAQSKTEETLQPHQPTSEKANEVVSAASQEARKVGVVPSNQVGSTTVDEEVFARAYASPAVRRFARELGVNLGQVNGTGRKGRISEEDIKAFVKQTLAGKGAVAVAAATTGSGIPAIPAVDFSQFGEIETQPLTRINILTGEHMNRCWLNIPHVTQNELADVTDLEAFRQSLKAQAEKRGVRVTMLSFLMKALVAGLQAYPRFNSSLSPDGKSLIMKKYYNIGVAVDTPNGLVVPVIREVDKKGIYELSQDLMEISKKARDGKLSPKDMSGACMTISSLGGIGGTSFTPIVNAPEVAILGVSRSSMQPVWNGKEFVPRLMLPLSMSYDHRVIDGALGARMIVYLAELLADFRKIAL